MINSCPESALKRIRESKNYEELLDVALNTLWDFHRINPLKPVAMVCGPISTGGKGSRQRNLEVFSKAINKVSNGGLLVFSQMPFEDDMERIYKSDPALQGLKLLEEFYLPLFKTGFIKLMCFLPGWENSIGANWEHDQAKKLNIPVLYLDQSYINDETP